jgi:hypothetical protein
VPKQQETEEGMQRSAGMQGPGPSAPSGPVLRVPRPLARNLTRSCFAVRRAQVQVPRLPSRRIAGSRSFKKQGQTELTTEIMGTKRCHLHLPVRCG